MSGARRSDTQGAGIKTIETKVVVLGHTDVGKTSLVNRYVSGFFPENTQTTIGAVYMKKTVQINNKYKIVLQIWDTAGQERFRSMAPMYYRGAHAAILVFDVTERETLGKIEGWVKELQAHASEDLVLAIAANKCDLKKPESEQLLAEAHAYAKGVGAKLFETSALTGKGIDDLYMTVAKALLDADLKKKAVSGEKGGVDLNQEPEVKQGCC